jgi:hypothetical protein
MNLRRPAGLGLLGCILLLLGGGSGPADTPGKIQERPGVDAKAGEALRRMSDFLGSSRELTFEVTNMADQVLDDGQKIQLSDRLQFSVRRPDRLAGKLAGDTRDELVW